MFNKPSSITGNPSDRVPSDRGLLGRQAASDFAAAPDAHHSPKPTNAFDLGLNFPELCMASSRASRRAVEGVLARERTAAARPVKPKKAKKSPVTPDPIPAPAAGRHARPAAHRAGRLAGGLAAVAAAAFIAGQCQANASQPTDNPAVSSAPSDADEAQ